MTEYAGRLQSGVDSIEKVRMYDTLHMAPAGVLQGRAGLRADGGGTVQVVAGSMQLEVSTFLGWVDGDASLSQAGYPFVNPATKTLTLRDGDASDRVDTVVARVWDTAFDNTGLTQALLEVVEGTPGGGAPILPDTCLPLRDVLVRAGVSAGTGGLTDADRASDRRVYTASLGGIVRVNNQAERNALPAYVDACKRLDLDRVEFREDGGWRTFYTDTREVQAGEHVMSGNGTDEKTGTVTFPKAFSRTPQVMAVMGGGGAFMNVMVTQESPTSFNYRVRVNSNDPFSSGGRIQWKAEVI